MNGPNTPSVCGAAANKRSMSLLAGMRTIVMPFHRPDELKILKIVDNSARQRSHFTFPRTVSRCLASRAAMSLRATERFIPDAKPSTSSVNV